MIAASTSYSEMAVRDTISHIVKIFWDGFKDEKVKAKLGVKTVAGIRQSRDMVSGFFKPKFLKELAETDQKNNGGSLLDARK